MAMTLFITLGLNTAQAAGPFQAGDFVSMPQLGGLEVQRNEITYAQWLALNAQLPAANQTPWKARDCRPSPEDHPRPKANSEMGIDSNYAAACISFNDAEAYIRVLNAQDANYTYRLPTYDEQSALVNMTLAALRFNGTISAERLSRHAWYDSNSGDNVNEVCMKEPVFGLCDILGNVFEWVTDYDDVPPSVGGGSWHSRAYILLSGRHAYGKLGDRHGGVGFRLVRTAK
jgi:formylglycine-generating enzyme required for sulfatase activity